MSDRLPPAEIDDAATDWLAKSERGLSQTEEVELDRWLNQDSRNLGAFVRAQAAWIHSERALSLGAMPEPHVEVEPDAPILGGEELVQDLPIRSGMHRRAFLAGGGAIAASAIGVGYFSFNRAQTLESSVGEVRNLALAGGTTLMLDTGTKVEVFDGTRDRRLKLIQGKIFLKVLAGDPQAFIVEAGGLAMEMVQGAFAIQAVGTEPLTALVAAGRLTISQGGGLFSAKRTVPVATGQSFTLPVGADLSKARVKLVAQQQLDAFLAWRDGMVSFTGEALWTAVRAFDRYGSTRIEVDPALGSQPVTGLFKANDPKGFAEAIAASFGAALTRDGDVIHLIKK